MTSSGPSKPSLDRPTFFGVADGRLAQSMTQEKFETLLLESFLFDDELIITDAFIFDRRVMRHILEREPRGSLFEVGLERGIIRPAIRTKVESVSELFGAFTAADRSGLKLTAPELDDVAQRLSEINSNEWRPLVWPARVSEHYLALLRECLQNEPPLDSDPDGVWASTEHLRTEIVEDAAAAAAAEDGSGVRRAELVARAGRSLGVLGPDEFQPDATVLLDRLADRPAEQRAAAHWFDWIDELYRINQAVRFTSRPMSVAIRPMDIRLVGRALAVAQHSDPFIAPSTRFGHPLELEVEVPSLTVISSLPIHRILELREFGADWRGACRRFIADPSPVHQRSAENALEEYAKRLRTAVREVPLTRAAVTLVALQAGQSVIEAAAEFLQWKADAPPLHTTVQVFVTGFFAVRYLRQARTTRLTVARGGPLDRITTLPPRL